MLKAILNTSFTKYEFITRILNRHYSLTEKIWKYSQLHYRHPQTLIYRN